MLSTDSPSFIAKLSQCLVKVVAFLNLTFSIPLQFMLNESYISLAVFNFQIFLYSFLDKVHVRVYLAFVFRSIMARSTSVHSGSGLENRNIPIHDNKLDFILGGLGVHLHFFLLIGAVFFSEAQWPCKKCSLNNELTVVICHLDHFLQTLLGAQPLEVKL